MKKLFLLAITSLIISSCGSDNGLREVYVEIDVKDAASDPDNVIMAAVHAFDANGNQLIAAAGVNGTDAPMTHTSDVYTFEKGQNVTYEMLSYDWDVNIVDLERVWAESRVRVYSGRKKILDITYMPGDEGTDFKNLIIE